MYLDVDFLNYMTLKSCLQVKMLFKGGDPNKELGVVERLLSGSAAGAISQTIIYPMEVSISN